jgi:hypothetical protein
MLADFLHTCFPSTRARAGLADRNSYLAALPDIHLATTPLVKTAIDTLCFAHLGSKSRDPRLIRESQRSYGKVLSFLVKATSRPAQRTPAFDPRAVVTSIMLLCLYDDQIPVHLQQGNEFATHYLGCQQLLNLYGARMFNRHEPFDRLLFWSLRMPCFFIGVTRRKATVMDRSDFIGLADILPGKKPLVGFYRIAMRLPAILESVDQVLQDGTSSSLQPIIHELCELRLQMITWLESLCQNSIDRYWEMPEVFSVSEIDAFNMETEEHCFITTSTTFTTFFKFHSPGHVVKNHTWSAVCCLVVDCTLLRLLHFLPQSSEYMTSLRSPQQISQDAFHQASDLCRSLHHYSSFDGLAYCDFTDFITELALNYFAESGAAPQLGWCQALRVATQMRRERIRHTIQPKTLCRMADAGPGFANAVRYRTRSLVIPR